MLMTLLHNVMSELISPISLTKMMIPQKAGGSVVTLRLGTFDQLVKKLSKYNSLYYI